MSTDGRLVDVNEKSSDDAITSGSKPSSGSSGTKSAQLTGGNVKSKESADGTKSAPQSKETFEQPKTKSAEAVPVPAKEEEKQLQHRVVRKPGTPTHDASDMLRVFIPVSISMFIVVICARNMESYKRGVVIPLPGEEPLYFKESGVESDSMIWLVVLVIAVFLVLIIIVTFIVFALVYFKFYKYLFAHVWLATFILLAFISSFQYYIILQEINYPISIVLFAFLLYNVVVVEMMSLFWKGPVKVQQATLLVLSAMITLTIILVLPTWATWVTLIALLFWDLVAVLTPCGPLKLLVDLVEKRGDDVMPVLIYTGSVSYSQSSASESRTSAMGEAGYINSLENAAKPSSPPIAARSWRPPHFSGKEDDDRGIMLGLGDFIFYSLLVGTAAMNSDWTTTLACYVSILTGLGFTLVLLAMMQRALPALPISIAFGIIVFVSSKYVTSKLVLEINRRLIFI